MDDDKAVRDGLRSRLIRLGFTDLVDCSSGEEAIQIIREKNLDLVIMDKVLKGMDGIQAARQILEEKPLIKIIITDISHFAIKPINHKF